MEKVKNDWPHEIVSGVPCLFCGDTPRTVVVRGSSSKVGLCEACAVEAHWAWRDEKRDVPAEPELQPTGEPRPRLLRVLLLRLAKPRPGEDPPDPLLPYSYELAVQASELPSTRLGATESDYEAVRRIFEPAGLLTWETFVEVLYDAYSARGELTRLVLCTAWARDPDDRRNDAARGIAWREWPPWVHTPSSAGLYAALRTVISLRLARFERESPRPPALSVELRQAAVNYIVTQQRVRRGEEGVDTSMLEYGWATMTEHERRVAAKIKEAEELGTTARDELAAETARESAAREPLLARLPGGVPRVGPPEESSDSVTEVSGGQGGPRTLAEAFDEEVEGDGGDEVEGEDSP